VRSPPRDRHASRVLYDALPTQQGLRFTLESELLACHRLGCLFAIIRDHPSVARELHFWKFYLSPAAFSPTQIFESTLAAISTFRIFHQACAFPDFSAKIHLSPELRLACESGRWAHVALVTAATSRFVIREKFWSALYPPAPLSVAQIPMEFDPLKKCSPGSIGLSSEFSKALGFGVTDRDDRRSVAAESLAFERALGSVDLPRSRELLEGLDWARIRAVAGQAGINVSVDPVWMHPRTEELRAEAAGIFGFAFFFDFLFIRKCENYNAWATFWRGFFDAADSRAMQTLVEGFMKAAKVADNLRGALTDLCQSDEALAVMHGTLGPSRRRLREICTEMPRSIRVVSEMMELPSTELDRIRNEWWSSETMLAVLRPYFAYRVGGVVFRVNIVRFPGGRITIVRPETPPRVPISIDEWLVTRGAGEELDDCPVCQEQIPVGAEYARLPCDHSCCKGCIQRWVNIVANCPLCRNPLVGGRNVRRRISI